jgi:hypothetical protein
MKTPHLAKSILTLVALLAAGGCEVREVGYSSPPPGAAPPVAASVDAEINVDVAPPPPMVETVTISPGPDFLWIGGAWVWNGRWVWERGHWGRRPHPGAVWRPHHYEYRNGKHTFVRGGWR